MGEKEGTEFAKVYSDFRKQNEPSGVFVKTILSILLLISSSLLVSCGAKKTSAVLEVTSSSLNMSNNVYPGGLIIMGKSSKGSFVVPIPANTGSGSSVTLVLAKDRWDFSAIGWEGASEFTGSTKCGATSVDLTKDEHTVNLNIDYTKCFTQTAVFGSANYHNGTNSFDILNIITCGWLYSDNVQGSITAGTPNTFCNSGSSLDAKYRNWAGSVKVEVLQNLNGVKSAGLSQCQMTGSDGLFSSILRLPEKGLPIKITLYKKTNCVEDSLISVFDFENGLGVASVDHDSLLNEISSTARLFLPSYDTKRGYSSLLANKPAILCSGLPCMSKPSTLPGGSNLIIRPNEEFVFIYAPTANQTCNLIASIGASGIAPSPTVGLIQANCEMRDGRMILKLPFTTLATASLTLTFNDASTATRTMEESGTSDAHNLAWELLGYPLSPAAIAPVRDSFSVFFEDNADESGLLTHIREMMGPEGAGGILGGLNCATDIKEKFVTFPDEGVFKTYRVQLLSGGSTQTLGTFVDDATTLPTDFFQKKILISRSLSSTQFIPEQVIYFNCADNIGRMESHHNETSRTEKHVIEWNTRDPLNTKAREFRYDEVRDDTRITRINTTYAFVESFPGFSTKAYARKWNLDINWNVSNYDYSSYTEQVYVEDVIPGFRYVMASPGGVTTAANTSDIAFATALTTSLGFSTNICVSKTSFAGGTCSVLPTTLGPSAYESPTFTAVDLAPANMLTRFSANL